MKFENKIKNKKKNTSERTSKDYFTLLHFLYILNSEENLTRLGCTVTNSGYKNVYTSRLQ